MLLRFSMSASRKPPLTSCPAILTPSGRVLCAVLCGPRAPPTARDGRHLHHFHRLFSHYSLIWIYNEVSFVICGVCDNIGVV
ncbi:hypothetical protein E2C01_017146 [Portunus trituberculatus]|uniref:Uncharacterized protein n=1 Tax=Portunus trituberculatus TaxID=210409 RepID=A0A5B7DS47_PORTR|nr:hypothetical protein [Portunus trituberculatus]